MNKWKREKIIFKTFMSTFVLSVFMIPSIKEVVECVI